jgi:hypothetical protein
MSSGVSNDQLIDLLRTTQTNLPDMDFEVALKYQEWVAVNEVFAKEKIEEDSGTSIVRNIVLDNNGNARMVRLYQKTSLNQGDTQRQITAPWCQTQTYYNVHRQEMLRNRKKAKFIDLVESKRLDGMISLAELLEERFVKSPENSADDLNPYGLPYWLNKADIGVSSVGDFIGKTMRYGDATTTTTVGGLDGSTYSRWKNWAATYTSVDSDLVARMRRAFHGTSFKSPTIAKDLKDGPASKYRIWLGLDELTAYEDLATKANDNIGSDMDPFHGNTTFRRVPLQWMPTLDADADNPIYGVNLAMFYPIVMSGDWMREDGPKSDIESHNVFTTFVDGTFQIFCKNRRKAGFVLSNVTTA